MVNNEIRNSLQIVCFALNKHKVEYLIIGGVAVGFYGYQRISGAYMPGRPEIVHDIDFWYNPSVSNYLNIVKALGELEIDTKELENLVFDPLKTFLRIPFDTFKVEFLPAITGLTSFSQCRKDATLITLDGNQLGIISYSDLLKNKEAVARAVDKQDIEELKKRNPKF